VYDDLIQLAERIAGLDSGRPKQAHLRRALSTAYYAIFHFLIDEACRSQIGAQHAQRGFRHVLGRGYTHGVMKQACASFAGGTLKASVSKGLPRDAAGLYVVPREIQRIAAIYVELQEKRHLADYDLTERFKRSEVLALIDETRARVANFQSLPASTDRTFFLACLWAWKELTNR
jgi:uncharacterized protein (UPF0332 family)